jgi:1,4-alpha-glucan branching enzyme
MLYFHHGHTSFDSYWSYFNGSVDMDAVFYLQMANEMLHSLSPPAITIAEDVSGLPSLCQSVVNGGLGFDYRLHMGVPSFWIKMMEASSAGGDDLQIMNMGEIVHTMTNRRHDEKCICYVECHDQCLVGDKTTMMWLLNEEIYTGMSTLWEGSLRVQRGIALHKLLRLVTFGLGGEGYLTFFGNEFGHPEWVDFPRKENGESYKYARRQWNLVEDPLLRYRQLNDFERCMIALQRESNFLNAPSHFICVEEARKIIVWRREGLLWFVNLHPCNNVVDFHLPAADVDSYRVLLDSNDSSFGGFSGDNSSGKRSVPTMKEPLSGEPRRVSLTVYPRTAIVLAPDYKCATGGLGVPAGEPCHEASPAKGT